ncbi:MAG TPA: diapophytoene dehydrogenase [Flavobacteriales bacterium]|nr:diapophytoene dehydrogenase [Flavobacteriales bacterium]
MGKVEIIMPKMGESVAEATIIKWLKQEGETIEAEEAVLEIATDKVDSEIPSPEGGVLVKQMFQENDVVKVGEVIAVMEVEGKESQTNGSTPEPQKEVATEKIEVTKVEEMAEQVAAPVSGASIPRNADGRFYSPLVRSIAQKEGISLNELSAITGSGMNDRVTKVDVLDFLKNRTSTPAPVQPTQKQESSLPERISAPKNITLMDGDEVVEMDRMRKLIADHMVMSKHTSPHVTSMVEVDVTNIVQWRNKIKDQFEKKEGEKMTFTPIFFEMIAKAIREMPGVNVSVDGNSIIKRKHINLGMATALPTGNLIVPVIKDADQKNLLGLTKSVNDLANRARNNKLDPDEIQGGTFTVTNVGTFGNVMGTPIIFQPQAAILALGAIRKKPAVIETPYGDTIGIRHMMFLSMSYDHRVIDGALGGSFIKKLADLFEAFDTAKTI